MGEILFIAHRLPFPPDRGDKIRSHHILKQLARIGPVHVATFADQPGDLAHEDELASVAASHCLVMRDKPLWRAGVEALVRGEPISLIAFRSARLAAYVRRTLAEQPIAAIYVFSGQMGQYVPADFGGRVVVDLVDVDSAKFDAYGEAENGPRAWIDRREGKLLAEEERRLAERAYHTLLVSEAEAELFRSRLRDHRAAKVAVLGNGIDTTFFDPAVPLAVMPLAGLAGPHISFTGQMDYAPNIAAAERLVDRILPMIRREFPEARCHIVGRNPPDSLRARHDRNGCHVWGEVPDVRPFIAGADLVAVPLEIARGVQNKVLEAMAMARPVLLTREAAMGIGGTDGEEFAIADDDVELVTRAVALLRDRAGSEAMGAAARAFVAQNRTWPAMLAGLEGIIGFGSGQTGSAGQRDAA